MRLLKIFLGLGLVVALAVFLGQNFRTPVDIWLYPGRMLEKVYLAYALVASLSIGLLMGFGIGLIQIFSHQSELRQQHRQLRKLRTELTALRNSALEVDIFKDDASSDAEPAPEPQEGKERAPKQLSAQTAATPAQTQALTKPDPSKRALKSSSRQAPAK